MKFKVVDALGREQRFEAATVSDAPRMIERTGKRNLFGLEFGRDECRFYLDRGTGPLWPITVQAAAVEMGMGGFE